MDPEVMKEVVEKLGIATTEVYRIYTEVQPLFGVKDILSIVIGFPVAIIVSIYVFKSLRKLLDADKSDDDLIPLFVMMSLFAGVVVMIITSLVFDGVFNGLIRIYHPEYFAIKEILSTVQ